MAGAVEHLTPLREKRMGLNLFNIFLQVRNTAIKFFVVCNVHDEQGFELQSATVHS